ncbi:MAG: class I SAM-dependent methyltransferase [Anaerolineae bacterium]
MNTRRFSGDIERLRSEERIARLELDRVVKLSLEGLQADSMLDIGTGSGLFAEAFAARGLRVVGVDVREDMLEAARQYVPQGDFKQGVMEALPFGEKTFDLAFMGMVLHEADDLVTALNESRRVAKYRLVVLEWPYEQGEFGPPLEHRLRSEEITRAAGEAGYTKLEEIPLTHLRLYRLGV